ncbi:hypothetical protein TIFTF001_007332 [Ficus carica]|uniref:Uncharacterized protein n=1 Tax=Ficus carica TaxID=3494 RepID=A0AA87ZQ64_FICCA|nr:hypothetical protein TIFTF001_007332 [Ficus carica]
MEETADVVVRMKINVDAAVCEGVDFAGLGGVIGDSYGVVVVCFSRIIYAGIKLVALSNGLIVDLVETDALNY